MTAPVKLKSPPKFKGEVFIIEERCKGCGFCIQFCPMKVLEFSKEYNAKGYHPPKVENPDSCIGCNLCGLYCPDFAIYAVKEKNNRAK
jgi:2-oxoglutarate ferredoxin oxidoreductase subunit delta